MTEGARRSKIENRGHRNKRLASSCVIFLANIAKKNRHLAGVAVFLMCFTYNDRDRKGSDMERNPHKTSPPFGDDSQPLFLTVAMASSAPYMGNPENGLMKSYRIRGRKSRNKEKIKETALDRRAKSQ